MNKSVKNIGIIVVILIIVIVFIYLSTNKKKYPSTFNQKSNKVTRSISPTTSIIPSHANTSPIQVVSVTPVSKANTSKYSDAAKAKIRSNFIDACKTKMGQEYGSQCNCGADYLASHYDEAVLARVYLEYHSTGKVPSEVQAAYNACK
jgi:hypothetical protein